MQLVIRGTAKTDAGYALFIVASHGIALAMMFPAAFCAGMTLPLVTYALLRAATASVRSARCTARTRWAAIVGVVFAAHVGMPLLGVEGPDHGAGAALDVALGLRAALAARRRRPDARPGAAPVGRSAGRLAGLRWRRSPRW